jgi:hypothetical protein
MSERRGESRAFSIAVGVIRSPNVRHIIDTDRSRREAQKHISETCVASQKTTA